MRGTNWRAPGATWSVITAIGVGASALVSGCTQAQVPEGRIGAQVLGRSSGGGAASLSEEACAAGIKIVDIEVTVTARGADGIPCGVVITTDSGTVASRDSCHAHRRVEYSILEPCEFPITATITNTTVLSNGLRRTVAESKTFRQ